MRAEPIAWTGWTDNGATTFGFLNVETYPSGEPLIKFDVSAQEVGKVLLRPKNFTDFMGGLFFIDSLVERGHVIPELILPFIPGARQDRLNSSGDFLFTAKAVAKLLNDRDFYAVTVLDPHSDVIAGLINKCKVIKAHECIDFGKIINIEYDCIISPDAGAEKRALAVATAWKLPLIHGWKTRDVSTGEITGFGFEDTGKNYKRGLVIDDICDGGGTFLGMAKPLFNHVLRADLWVTHGIFSKGTRDLLEIYGNIYCTDSVVAQRPGINIIQLCDKLLND